MNLEQIIGLVIGAIVTLTLAWIKGYFDVKKTEKLISDKEKEQDEKLVAQVKLIVNELKGISTSIVNLELELKAHTEETDFIRDLRDAIKNRSKQILYLSLSLNQRYKNILAYWSDIIEKYADDFYNNKNRNTDRNTFEKQLTQDMTRELEDFNNYIDNLIDEYRVVKEKKMTFSKYLNVYQVHNKTHLLVSRLIENGFKEKHKIIDIFVKYIDDYFSVFLTAVVTWQDFELYNYETENAA